MRCGWETDQVEVKVTFYDRIIGTGLVEPTGGTVPQDPLRPEGRWPEGEVRSLTATYILKKGFRQEEQQRTGQKRIYEGYRVQVFYRDELQDEDAQPRSLLKMDKTASAEAEPVSTGQQPVPR